MTEYKFLNTFTKPMTLHFIEKNQEITHWGESSPKETADEKHLEVEVNHLEKQTTRPAVGKLLPAAAGPSNGQQNKVANATLCMNWISGSVT
ncbi:hypothetical protein J6590_057185 [Homalodisca vitripennis]|nr:hypothetical protein J6590_057185 [Homalodisca vitripennis]